ncbi:Pro-Pol polyprotein [Portunus trituberculatus]|uniref:Pro-Pol polyprotein n=1 Tax=Portunus trituberculatus TaxID=210409 RepID=A0A5B7G7V6_PORTR|nr:Pro-Pol polyprotein [Portunus trituberculatus]
MINRSQGYRYLFTIVDHFSRFVKFYTLKSKHTHSIIEALEQYVTDFGTPQSIVLDNGGESISFKGFCQQNLITLYYTTPYHPQRNGITKRLHCTFKSILAALCQGHPLRWLRLLQT